MKRLISQGTSAAFDIGEATSKARGGCAPGLREAVAACRANSAKADPALIEIVARAMRFAMRPDGFEYDNSDEAWAKVPKRAKEYWRDFARISIEIVAAQRTLSRRAETTGSAGTESGRVGNADAPNLPNPSRQSNEGVTRG